MSGCLHCAKKWFGNKDPAINHSEWHCRKSAAVRRKDMPVIGDDAALRAAPGCKDFAREKHEA